MTTQVPLWLGSQEVTETPDSPRWGWDVTKITADRIYEGPYLFLLYGIPTQGRSLPDMPAYLTVQGYTVESLPGGKGRMTLHLETIGETPENEPTYEVDWVSVEKPLIQAPCFSSGGDYELSTTDQAQIAAWEQVTDPTQKAAFNFASGQTLSNNAQRYASKRLRGQETYVLYAPVARETTNQFVFPSSNPCGYQDTPDFDVPDGYVWVRTGDKCTKTGTYGKWQQAIEWSGSDSVDEDLYPIG